MRAYLKRAAVCAAMLAGAATPVWATDAATCNQRHTTCLQGGGNDTQCLTAWHQCRQGGAAPARVSAPVRPAPAKAPAAPRPGGLKLAVQR